MKLGSIGARALLLFAGVGLVPVFSVVALLISVNRQAVQTSEQHLQAAVLEELERAAIRHVEDVRQLVFDQLTPAQVGQLHRISERLVAGIEQDCSTNATPIDQAAPA